MIDRLGIRERPSAWPVMYQTWGKLLFMHWRMPVEHLRPLIPPRLEIDTFEGDAWMSLTPFTMWGIRPVALPAVPGLSQAHELNARTYVHLDGVPGVWFFSLDANNTPAVEAARFLFHLPYYRARMDLIQEGAMIRFSSERTDSEGAPARLQAEWRIGEPIGEAEPGTLEFFLVERYCLYSARGDNLYRARIHHRPWPLQAAALFSHSSTMFAAQGLPEPTEPPLTQYAEELEVGIWPPEKV